MALGQRVKTERERKGWSQAFLAERAGMQQETISAIERRDSKRSEYTQRLAEALGVPVEYLLTGEHPELGTGVTPPKTAKPSNFLRRLSEFQKEYETLPGNERELVDEALKQQAELRRLLKGEDEQA